MDKNKQLSWHIEEYTQRKKTLDWFGALGIIAVAGAAAAVLVGNILFAILIIVGASVLALFAARKPDFTTITLQPRGIQIGSRLYPYSAVKSFWVLFDEDPAQLLLSVQSSLMPQLSIPIHDVSPDDVRLFLSQYVEEVEQKHDSLTERIMERLGF